MIVSLLTNDEMLDNAKPFVKQFLIVKLQLMFIILRKN